LSANQPSSVNEECRLGSHAEAARLGQIALNRRFKCVLVKGAAEFSEIELDFSRVSHQIVWGQALLIREEQVVHFLELREFSARVKSVSVP
jgi:hypothetical protein